VFEPWVSIVVHIAAMPTAPDVLYAFIMVNGQHVRLVPVRANLTMTLCGIGVICSSFTLKSRNTRFGFRTGARERHLRVLP
jgi:hypothetical protein